MHSLPLSSLKIIYMNYQTIYFLTRQVWFAN